MSGEEVRILDMFRLNDWPFRNFITIVSVLLLSILGLIALDSIKLEIPILRELIGFLFLTFIPGFLLVRILRVHNLDIIETVLYSVGSSLSFLMLSGLFINLLYPTLGIQKPLSSFPLLTTLVILTLAMGIACYYSGNFTSKSYLNVRSQLFPHILSLLLIPFLSIFGAYIFNIHDNNTLILILLFMVSLLPALIAFGKISEELHGLTIFIASISLLFHVSLISWHVWGWDIHHHLYWSNLVQENLYLHLSEYSLLFTTILPTTYSLVTGLSLVWIYKLFIPFFFSLVPLGIFSVCRKEFKGRLIPALAPFPFMFFYAFFETFPVKQLPAELFVILLAMLVVDKKMSNFSKMLLAILFSFSLIVTHYGVSYFFMLILIFAVILLHFSRTKISSQLIEPGFTILFIVLTISWYMFTSEGSRFEQIVKLGHHITTNLAEMLQAPPGRSGFAYAIRTVPTLTWVIYKYLNYLLMFFITLGIICLLVSLIKRRKICQSNSFAAFSLGFYGFLVSSIIITYGMGFDRITQITFVLLAPYAVIGCRYAFELLVKRIKPTFQYEPTTSHSSSKFFGVFLMIFLLFSSGFAFEMVSEDTPPYCVALDKDNWEPWNAYYQGEVRGAEWVKKYSTSDKISSLSTILSKDGTLLVEHYRHIEDFVYFNPNTASLPSNICIYLGNLAVKEGKIPYMVKGKVEYIELNKTPFYQEVLSKSNKIFDSGCAHIYHVP